MRETGILALRSLVPIFAIAFFTFTACGELSDFDTRQVQSSLNDSLTTTTESWDVEMILMNNGRARILIEGSHAISYQMPERKETHIRGPVYVQLYDSTGAVETEAWSKRAVYYDAKSEFELFDSVRVNTAADRQLYSDFLLWSERTDRISSPDFVIIVTPSDSISGRGFESGTDLSDYIIDEPRGHFIVD